MYIHWNECAVPLQLLTDCSAYLKNKNVFGQVCALDAISSFSETQYMLRLFPPGFKEINVEFDP